MLTNDELQEMFDRSKARVNVIAQRRFEAIHESEIQQSELAQYLSMTPGDHSKLFAQVGKEKYGEYAVAMEKVRRQSGG